MDLTATISLFLAMTFIAVVPGPGVFVLVSRCISRGYRAGLVTSIGMLVGDYIFILLAIFGLSFLSQLMGGFFIIIKYVGAAYIMWLGIKIIFKRAPNNQEYDTRLTNNYDFVTGLITTLANPKAILFYVSFFPTFVDLSTIQFIDIVIIFMVATFSIFSVTYFYIYTTIKIKHTFNENSNHRLIQYGSGTILFGSGLYIALRA